MLNESSAFLWHKRLGHISKERLVKNEILPNLDFTDLGLCVDCIKGKQTRHNKKGATRSSQLLEVIHTDICGPFDTPSLGGGMYSSLLTVTCHVIDSSICLRKSLRHLMPLWTILLDLKDN